MSFKKKKELAEKRCSEQAEVAWSNSPRLIQKLLSCNKN
jgi:hypothetical protein